MTAESTAESSPLSPGEKVAPASKSPKGKRFPRFFDPYERLVLGSLIIVLICGWAFVALSSRVMQGSTQSVDERILLALRSSDDISDPIGSARLEEIGRDLTALGGYAFLILLMVGVTTYLFLAGKEQMGYFLIASVVSGFIVAMSLKGFFQRPRPEVVPHHSYVSTSSFPSGHSMMSMIVFLTMGVLLARISKQRKLKLYSISVAVLLSILIGCSRVYVGVHYPTDVLAGWTAGVMWATLSCLIASILERRGVIGLHEPAQSRKMKK